MRKVLLGVAMAAVLAFAASGPPVQPIAEPTLSQVQPQSITKVIDNGTAVREASGYTVKAVWHGKRAVEDVQVAAAKKREGATRTDSRRGSKGSSTQASLAPESYPLRL